MPIPLVLSDFSTQTPFDLGQTMSVQEQFEVDLEDKTPNMTG
jgi:hypothetical protein